MRSSPGSKRVNTGFLGKEKLQKTNPSPLAGLANAQKNKVLPQSFLCCHPLDDFAQFTKCTNCILGVVVVPRYVIALQEREQLLAILDESLFIAESYLRGECPL